MSKKGESLADRQGFSIIELIVTISILVIINTVIFASYPKFRQSISLRKTSQEVASMIYQAQTFSLSVKEFQGGYPSAYGVHFDKEVPDAFVLFADVNENFKYDDGVDGENIDEKVENFKIQTSDEISGIYGVNDSCDNCSLEKTDIIFKRPKAVAFLTDGAGEDNLFSSVKIKIKSLQGQERTINVWLSGQISISTE